VQETLLRGLDKINLYRSGTDLRAWLFTIMHNHTSIRSGAPIRQGEGFVVEKLPVASRAPQLSNLELRDLERAIARLSMEQRTTLLLIGLEGMKYEEVAQICGVPIGTVRSRLCRAREEVRRMIGGRDAGPAAGPMIVMLRQHGEAVDAKPAP
jgi:RNA polymerase sigma-70 factor (ECF subfamily)